MRSQAGWVRARPREKGSWLAVDLVMNRAMVTPAGFTTLPLTDKAALAAEILVTYARMRLVFSSQDLTRTVQRLRAPSSGPKAGPEATSDPEVRLACLRLGRAVARTLRPLPTDSRCLMSSLVLLALLAQRGIASTLVIGVSPGPEFKAHAWVELGGEALLPSGGDEYSRLTEL